MKIKIFLTCFLVVNAFAKEEFSAKVFRQAIDQVKKQSLYSLDDRQIYRAALEGVLGYLEKKNKEAATNQRLGFNANQLVAPNAKKDMNKDLEGQISGIGISLRMDSKLGDQYPVILNVIDGGGAEDAGLKKGDQILKIDSVKTGELNQFKSIVGAIRGKAGSRVKLQILRDGELLTKRVSRKKIIWNAVEVADFYSKYAYLKISMFNKKTVEGLKNEIAAMKKEKLSRLIVDLRGNSGGLLDAGIESMKLFAKKNEKLLRIAYKNSKEKVFSADQKGPAANMSFLVLVDKETRSMGEAFASFLSEARGAKIIGERTCGKGTVEKMIKLSNDYSIKLTIGQLTNSAGKSWDKLGLTPDILVRSSKKLNGRDPAREVAKAIFLK